MVILIKIFHIILYLRLILFIGLSSIMMPAPQFCLFFGKRKSSYIWESFKI